MAKRKKKKKSASSLLGGLGANEAVRSGAGAHVRPQDKRAKQKLERMIQDEA